MKKTSLSLRPASLAVLPLLAAVLAGCAPKPTIVGKWQGTLTQPGGAITSTFEFTQGGKETITSQATGGGTTVDITAGGTYTVSGTSLTQTLTTMTLRGQPMPIPPGQAKSAPFTLDGDRLTLTSPGTGEPLTLTRVKE